MKFHRAGAPMAVTLRGCLLLSLCCLLCLCSSLAVHAQTPAARMLWTQTDFTGMVAYSPTEPLIAAAEGFGEIALLHPDGTLEQTIYTGQGYISSLAFSPDGQSLACGSWIGTLEIWRVSNGACLQTFNGDTGYMFSLAFAPDGQMLASGDGDCLKLWRVSDGACLQTLGINSFVVSVAFAPDGQTLASGDENGVQLWRVSDGVCLRTFNGYADPMYALAFSPDGQTLASGGGQTNGFIYLWRVSDGSCLQALTGLTNYITSVAFAPDGQMLASGDGYGIINFWQVSDGICLQTLSRNSFNIWSLAFAADGQTLATGNGDGTINLWCVSDGSCVQTFTSASSNVTTVAFAPDGQTLASGSPDKTIKLWRVSDGAWLRTLSGNTDIVWSVAFSPDGQTLASGSMGNTIKLWRVSDGACLWSISGGMSPVTFAPDGQTLVSGGVDNTIKFWAVSDGACLRSISGGTSPVAFAPDGQTLASGGADNTIKFWRVSDGACLQTLTGQTDGVDGMVFSPDGQTLASYTANNTIKLWRVSDGACEQTLTGYVSDSGNAHSIDTVAFAPNGQTLASGSQNNIIDLWRVSDGACLQSITGCNFNVLVWSLAFAPDGRTLAAGCGDGVVLWSLPLTDVTLTAGVPSPTTVGTQVKLCALPTGGIQPEYRFYALYPNANGQNQTLLIRDYAATSTCTWTPTFAANYTLVVCCREHGSSAQPLHAVVNGYAVKPALTAVALAVTPSSPTPLGAIVKLRATPTGGLQPEYQFYALYPVNGQNQTLLIRDYAATSTCTWSPTFTANYTLVVCCREQGSTARPVYFALYGYVVKPALTAVLLAVTPTSPVSVGTTVQFRATPTGGAQPEYRFYALYPVNGQNQMLLIRDYGTTSTCTWTPTFTANYTLVVCCREHGGTARPLYSARYDYVVKPALSAVVLAVTPDSPTTVGTTVRLHATPTGGAQPEYLFYALYRKNGQNQMLLIRDYGMTSTCAWTPTFAASYTLVVCCREQGSTAHPLHATVRNYQVTAKTDALSALSLPTAALRRTNVYNVIHS